MYQDATQVITFYILRRPYASCVLDVFIVLLFLQQEMSYTIQRRNNGAYLQWKMLLQNAALELFKVLKQSLKNTHFLSFWIKTQLKADGGKSNLRQRNLYK